MTRTVSLLSLPLVLALAPAAAQAGPSLRKGGDGIGADTRGFSFYNERSIGLMYFMFDYEDGDHGVTRLGHMVGVGAVHNWMSGQDPDHYVYDVKHFPKPGTGEVLTAAKEGCSVPCALGIPAAPEDHELVLSGFLFEIPDGSEQLIHTIAIEPDADDGKIWVTLEGEDPFFYDAVVQYSYIPTEDVVGGAAISGTGTSPLGNPRVSLIWPEYNEETTVSMLQGFRIETADDEARPLQYLHVRVGRHKANVWFHDESGNEPFDATVWLVPATYETES